MSTTIKIILGLLLGLMMGFLSLTVFSTVFMHFYTKSPGPIQEYEFPNMTYQELESKISKIMDNKINAKFKLTQEELDDKQTSRMRIVVLGKDSLQFGFVTIRDEGYKYKTKDYHLKGSSPWLELFSVCNSDGKYIGVFRKNRDEHTEVIKLFEDEFIKKINNGEVNAIERSFWYYW